MEVNWFADSKGGRQVLVVGRDARIVSPGANEASPVRDETV